jgi:hypothetical protein
MDRRGYSAMQIILSYPSRPKTVAFVLAVGADFIRVATPECIDGFDILLHEEEWVTERGRAVRVDAIVLGDAARFPAAVSTDRGDAK